MSKGFTHITGDGRKHEGLGSARAHANTVFARSGRIISIERLPRREPLASDERDTFWSRPFKGHSIQGHRNRTLGREFISVLDPDHKVHQTQATTLRGAQVFVNRLIKEQAHV